MKVGIIGGGASGMMAAHIASKYGHEVTILEKMPRVGKKLLVTGSGRCNLTNEDMDLRHFHSNNSELVLSVLNSFSKEDLLNELSVMGLYAFCKNGYYYPYSEQASSVLDILRLTLEKDKVITVTDAGVSKISKISERKSFKVETLAGDYIFDKVILCAGSKAAPKTGSDGSGYILAKSLGHTIIKPLQALCALRCEGINFKSVAGIRCKGSISVYAGNRFLGTDKGELQLTAYGISGIPAMQVSYLAAKALDDGRKVTAKISFLPDYDRDSLIDYLNTRINNNPGYSAEEFMTGLLHKNLCQLLLKQSGIKADSSCCDIDNKKIGLLADNILELEVLVKDVNSFDDSQVCQGGVSLGEVMPTLESNITEGLYFAGEILDVNGDCGGYNLQWAWSSGAVAGRLG